MTSRVVVGIDGSPSARCAAELAAHEAERHGATLEVVHCFDVPITATDPMGAAYVAIDHDELVASARLVLDSEVQRLRTLAPGVQIEPSLHEGSARSVLVDASKDADLIVVGTRQASELAGFVLGSVCRHVLHRAHCPVAVVPSPSPAHAAA
jgi:nucleotide-binding universal stress UspA family protein